MKLSYWRRLAGVGLFCLGIHLSAAEVWDSPAFTADATTLRQAAAAVKAGKHDEATVLLNDLHFTFDETGKMVQTRHLIYRIENQQGVENWAETSGRWQAWHQQKPEIKARVIASDGTLSWLDPKTLNDFPVHESEPDIYSDERRYGGPLPAIAPGAIVEEEVVVHDNAALFAAGTVHTWGLEWAVPVNKTHVAIIHPASTLLRYQVDLLPNAQVSKSTKDGLETITIDQGPLPAEAESLDHVPADVVLYPEIEFSTGTSWQMVATAYAHLSEEKIRPSDVQTLIEKINAKDGSRSDIIRRIVASLHKNVRYTGIEFGESSLIPQFPSETLKRKYGDCKDKAVFLVSMLRSAGIAANLALVDTGPGKDINKDLPGLGMFDHVIVYVPASGPDPDLWIDATAQYSQVGWLPWMDYGRWALVVSDKTESLKQTPEVTAGQNLHTEFREFTLAEHGMATIVETDDEVGPNEADYREYYSGDSKKIRENSETYVKDMYLSDSLTSLDHGDLSDLEKPASIKFTTKGKRGNTELTTAVAAIRMESLFDSLPKYFRRKEEPPVAESEESEKPKPRTVDWLITPFTTEWRYKVIAPPGFKLRALPGNKSEKIDTLTLNQKYSSNAEGTIVEAEFRVENTNARLTVQQAVELRDAVLKARNVDPIFISFDHLGYSLISAGKIKEGLAAYQRLVSQHPKEALHKVQFAEALLSVGLGEQARSVAQEATSLEPNSALAFSTLAKVLKNDLIGRPIMKGMDYDGAVAAYRKAIALDPKDKETRANLALMLEYDHDGTRYGEHAPLQESVAELHALQKLDEDYSRSYDDNILYDLWYAHDPQGVLDYAKTLSTSDVRKGLTLAAVALLQGTDAALKKSVEITTDDQIRSRALATSGTVLLRVRKYPEAAVFVAEAAHGQSSESQAMRSAAIISKTKPYEEIKIDPTDPRSVVQQLFGEMISGKLTLDEYRSLVYDDNQGKQPDQKRFAQMMAQVKGGFAASGMPGATVADLAVSNMRYTVDGDDVEGYQIIVESPGAAAQDIYVIKDGPHYKSAAFSANGSILDELGDLALRALEKNNLPAARKWLDRARDKMHVNGGDDPLSGSPFPYFWTKGQGGDLSTIRTAALVLLPSEKLKGQYLIQLDQARKVATTDIERNRLTMVMAYGYSAQKQWAEMLPLTKELLDSSPTSIRAFELAAKAYNGLKQFDEWEKLVQSRLQKNPEELTYVRSSAQLAANRGQFSKCREILKGIIDKGQANESDLNLYAWYALDLPNPIDQDTIDLAQRANDLSKNNSFAILHTLACVNAQAGKTGAARDLLIKAMDAQHLEEPNSEIWLGFALIAEQYGVTSAADKMFGRVEKPEIQYPGSSYDLAQQHVAALQKVHGL
jgi:tetratricopeptide (TPR) repeat protein